MGEYAATEGALDATGMRIAIVVARFNREITEALLEGAENMCRKHDAAEVTGQIFGVRGKEIFLFSQPRPVRSIHRDGGWSPEQLVETFRGTLGRHLVPLEGSAQYFSYDPLV